MEFVIRIKTPGAHLSFSTLFGVASDIAHQLQLAAFDALVEEFPTASKTQIKRLLKNKVDLQLEDAKKGSWELVLVGALGGAIGGVVANLATDLIKGSEQWAAFKEKTYSISDRAAKHARERLTGKSRLGTFNAENKSVNVKKMDRGSRLEVDAELSRRRSGVESVHLEEQVNDLIAQLEARSNND